MAVEGRPAGTVVLPGGGVSLQGLDLVAPCLDLRVFTPPAVQWEPVVTNPNPNVAWFPSPVGFLDDGGPTQLGASDVTLVPVEPAPLLDKVVSAYDGGEAAAALFTLPFGMMAVATLPKRPTPSPILFPRPGLTPVEPVFIGQNMQGGRQVSLTAAVFELGERSPSLPGATVQLRNVVDVGGTPQNLSVLGPAVDTIFNTELNPGAATALVPVTRIDFSGYGASSFSAWTDPSANVPAVVQVRFNMMVGRASHEVVQVKSILYPWGAIVVRTITIDRQDNAEVFRYDSGWVAATPGTFGNMAGITVHPGAVHGAFNIREIRDTTHVYKDAGGTVEMTAVYFDADIQIDGVVTGARNGLVPSRGQLGFVQEKPIRIPIGPADLAALIQSQGALGGPVDCVIAIAGTAQTMRLQRVEVGNAPNGTGAEFAAAARGSLTLPAQGSWSVLARTDGVSEPTPIHADLGVPLIRQGPAGSPPGNTPWRLTEPADLLVPNTPSMDYCLLHATVSTRILFPRPKIESGASAFTSDVAPLLTDGFALMAATGICPRQDACLAFPNATYQLQITGPGALTLSGLPPSFSPSISTRALASGAASAIGFDYADENGTPCQVAVAIQPDSWSVELKGVSVRLDITPFNGLMRTVGDVQAASGRGVSFGNAKLVLGSALQPLQDLLPFLGSLGLPRPLKLSFSNSGWTTTSTYKLAVVAKIDLDPPSPNEIEFDLGFGNAFAPGQEAGGETSHWFANFDFKLVLQLPWPPPPWVGILKIDVASPEGKALTKLESGKLKFQLGIIYPSKGNFGRVISGVPATLELECSIAAVFTLVWRLPSLGLGIGAIIDGAVKIMTGHVVFAQIQFTAEANGLVIVTPKPLEVQFVFDIAVDVSVFWFADFTFEWEAQYDLTF